MRGDIPESWKTVPEQRQKEWYNIFKDDELEEIDISTDWLCLMKTIGFAIFGHPSDLPKAANDFTGYNKEQLEKIEQILSNIKHGNDRENKLVMSKILIIIKMEDKNSDMFEDVIFRIFKCSSEDFFVDRHSRVYSSWDDFKKENLILGYEYCCPKEGNYKEGKYEYIKCHRSKLSYLDTIFSCASLATTGVTAVSCFTPIAPAVALAATASTVTTGIYSILRSTDTLADRQKHQQSIAVTDREAFQSWLNIVTSGLAGAGGLALSRASSLYKNGKEVSKSFMLTVRGLNTASVAVSGFGTLHSFFYCIKKYEDKALTKQDIFNLSCEILFFFNAVANVKTTSNLLSAMESTDVMPARTRVSERMKQFIKQRQDDCKKMLSQMPHTLEDKFYTSIAADILSVAKVAFDPRTEMVLLSACSLGLDIKRLKAGTIELGEFFGNSYFHMKNVCTTFRDEIEITLKKIQTMLYDTKEKCVEIFYKTKEKCVTKVKQFFLSATERVKLFFTVIFLSVKVKFENFFEKMRKTTSSQKKENTKQEDEVNDNLCENSGYRMGDISMQLFEELCNTVEQGDIPCDSLETFTEDFANFSDLIIHDLNSELDRYSEHYKIFGDQYNDKLQIQNVEEYIVKKVMDGEMNKLFKKNLLKCIRKVKQICYKNNEVWQNIELNGVKFYHYLGEEGEGHLKSNREKLINALSQKTREVIKLEHVDIFEHEDTVILMPKKDTQLWFKAIFVFCELIENNTSSYLITVFYNQENEN